MGEIENETKKHKQKTKNDFRHNDFPALSKSTHMSKSHGAGGGKMVCDSE
jgi:hypothetical protein